jgi:hypothetical protein
MRTYRFSLLFGATLCMSLFVSQASAQSNLEFHLHTLRGISFKVGVSCHDHLGNVVDGWNDSADIPISVKINAKLIQNGMNFTMGDTLSFSVDTSAGLIRNLVYHTSFEKDIPPHSMSGMISYTLSLDSIRYDGHLSSGIVSQNDSSKEAIVSFHISEDNNVGNPSCTGSQSLTTTLPVDTFSLTGLKSDVHSRQVATTSFSISENIVTETIHASFPPLQNTSQLEIFDMLGRKKLVIPIQANCSSVDVPLSALSSGCYFATITNRIATFIVFY